jgi:hypothetical protein
MAKAPGWDADNSGRHWLTEETSSSACAAILQQRYRCMHQVEVTSGRCDALVHRCGSEGLASTVLHHGITLFGQWACLFTQVRRALTGKPFLAMIWMFRPSQRTAEHWTAVVRSARLDTDQRGSLLGATVFGTGWVSSAPRYESPKSDTTPVHVHTQDTCYEPRHAHRLQSFVDDFLALNGRSRHAYLQLDWRQRPRTPGGNSGYLSSQVPWSGPRLAGRDREQPTRVIAGTREE